MERKSVNMKTQSGKKKVAQDKKTTKRTKIKMNLVILLLRRQKRKSQAYVPFFKNISKRSSS